MGQGEGELASNSVHKGRSYTPAGKMPTDAPARDEKRRTRVGRVCPRRVRLPRAQCEPPTMGVPMTGCP